jgi:hypothetical protein
MRARRIIEGATFCPEVLAVVRQAFEESWTQVAGMFPAAEHEGVREELAKAVIVIARSNSNDPRPIREAAVQALKRRYPSRFSGDDGKEAVEQ